MNARQSSFPIRRFGALCDVTLGKMLQTSAVGEGDQLMPYLKARNITEGGLDLDVTDEMWCSNRERSNLGIEPGDLLVSEGGDVGRSALAPQSMPVGIVFQNSVHRVRPRSGVNIRFIKYALDAVRINGYMEVLCNKATIAHLTHEKLTALLIPSPSERLQDSIATFLDRKTAEADALVAKYERLIELLEEKRAAMITRVIAKGLNPNVPMRDIGIEWVGEIPAHWEIGQVRRYYSVTDCKHVTVEFEDDGIPVVSVREVKGAHISLDTASRTSERWFNLMIAGGRLPRRGDVVFCRNVSPGTCSYVGTDERFAMGQDVCLIRSRYADGRYFNYVMRSNLMKTQLGLVLIGSTFNRINVRTIESLIIPHPGRDEQAAIVSWLDERLNALDAQTAQIKTAIELVHEHRAALITAAVTGQIDVYNGHSKQRPVEVSV